MVGGDRGDQRETEAAAAVSTGSPVVETDEALEDPLTIVGRDAGSVVVDHDLDRRRVRTHLDAYAGRSMADGVAEQVVDRTRHLDLAGDDGRLGEVAELELDATDAAISMMLDLPSDELGDVERCLSVRLAGGGELGEVVEHQLQPVDASLEPLDGRLGVVRELAHRQQLGRPPHDRERRAELVRRIGDELTLADQAGIEPVQHPVQGVGQLRDLVARLGNGQAAARSRRGDSACLLGDRADRPERRTDRPPERKAARSGEQRHQHDHRPAEPIDRPIDDADGGEGQERELVALGRGDLPGRLEPVARLDEVVLVEVDHEQLVGEALGQGESGPAEHGSGRW
ncbi:MAG: hypothetical protein AAGA99_11095 [Actinomycetota bacterium]